MRRSLVGALLGTSLVIAVTASRSFSDPPYAPQIDVPMRASGSELFTNVTATEGQPLIVTVVDPRQRVLAIYQADRASGEITLKSVRNITWDLQMTEYNSGKPSPQEIRSGLKH